MASLRLTWGLLDIPVISSSTCWALLCVGRGQHGPRPRPTLKEHTVWWKQMPQGRRDHEGTSQVLAGISRNSSFCLRGLHRRHLSLTLKDK